MIEDSFLYDCINTIIRPLRSAWYNCKYGVINLIKWLPIIWGDRDWDHYYLYRILQKKLKHMENFHRNHGHCVGNEAWADQMKGCIKLIENLLDDEYNRNEFDALDKKWGTSFFEETNEKGSFELKHKNIKTKEDEEEHSKEFRECMTKERKLREEDKDELFKLIRENIDCWWD